MSNSNNEQMTMFDNKENPKDGPVTCLGMTFNNDEERRAFFTEELRKILPELKKMEGFPIGKDEDILALSDPPYYTACPNPWIKDFIQEWGIGCESKKDIIRQPFSNDVKEGKNDPIYIAHSYHTKVPHKAIMRYILHYTEPGDVIYDGFSGSGMTGVAAQLCGDKESVEELGFNVVGGDIVEIDLMGNKKIVSKFGSRNVVMSELSPAATFISHIYNKPTDPELLSKCFNYELNKLEYEFQYLYFTCIDKTESFINELANRINSTSSLTDIKKILIAKREHFGKVNYVVWSDVYVCSNCVTEFSFWEATVKEDKKTVMKEPICPKCQAILNKNKIERAWLNYYDQALERTINIAKQVPVLINYSYKKKRYEKVPDKLDITIMKKIQDLNISYSFPTDELPGGYNLNQPQRSHGIKNVHHFYPERTLLILEMYLKTNIPNEYKQFLLGSVLPKLTKMNRYMPQHGSRALVGPMANVLYFPPMSVENNVIDQLIFQSKKIAKALNKHDGNVITTQSSTNIPIDDNSVDYIFIDPPFGANIMYSDLNFVRESWLKIKTNFHEEVIENSFQDKSLEEYRVLMIRCLKEAFRVLKPGRWITVEFSNTKASVWNSIQTALQEAGFIIASVDALDKTRGGLYSMITTVGVKQDLIISAYKPGKRLDQEGKSSIQTVFDFVKSHLEFIPVTRGTSSEVDFIYERDPRILYDRMIAYFVRMSMEIPMSSIEFQELLQRSFPARDGMVFLEDQVAEYDKKRLLAKEFVQLNIFVSDENSAIEWIRQQLMNKPQTRQDLHPNYMKEIQHIAKHELLPELDQLLEQNFLMYEGIEPVPSQIHTYLSTNYKDLRGLDKGDPRLKEKAISRWYVPDPNKQADLEKLREKSLLREFTHYKDELEKSKKKLKQFRTEAIRAGFKKAWGEKDYNTIVKVGERLPESVIQEDDKLLMYFDNAQIRLGM